MEAILSADELLQLATWNRERSVDELRSYVTARLASLPDDEEVE